MPEFNTTEVKILVACEQIMNELATSCEQDRYGLFGILNHCKELNKSHKQDLHEFWETIIKVHAQLRIPLKSFLTNGDKLGMSCK